MSVFPSKYKGRDAHLYLFEYKNRRYRKNGFYTKADALAAERAKYTELLNNEHALMPKRTEAHSITIEKIFKDYCAKIMRAAAPGKEARLKRHICNVLGKFAESVGESKRIVELTTDDINKWKNKELERCAPQSVRVNMWRIRGCLNNARRTVPGLYQWTLPLFEFPKVPKRKRERIISEDDLQRLKQVLLRPRQPGEHRSLVPVRRDVFDLIEFGLGTTARLDEMLKFKWKDADLKRGRLRIFAKGGRERWITMSDLARNVLERRRFLTGKEEKVFLYDFNKNYSKLQIELRRACLVAGIPYGVRDGITFHSTRHTAITIMLLNGVDIRTIMLITGHETLAAFEKYIHSNIKAEQAALAKLSQAMSLQPVELPDELTGFLTEEERRMWLGLPAEMRQKLGEFLGSSGEKEGEQGERGKFSG